MLRLSIYIRGYALYLQQQCHSCQGPFGRILFGFQVKCPHVGRSSLFGLVDRTLVDVTRLLLVYGYGLDEDDWHGGGEFFQTGVDDHTSLQHMTHGKRSAVKSLSCHISECRVAEIVLKNIAESSDFTNPFKCSQFLTSPLKVHAINLSKELFHYIYNKKKKKNQQQPNNNNSALIPGSL